MILRSVGVVSNDNDQIHAYGTLRSHYPGARGYPLGVLYELKSQIARKLYLGCIYKSPYMGPTKVGSDLRNQRHKSILLTINY